jgi:hypothetical protein
MAKVIYGREIVFAFSTFFFIERLIIGRDAGAKTEGEQSQWSHYP